MLRWNNLGVPKSVAIKQSPRGRHSQVKAFKVRSDYDFHKRRFLEGYIGVRFETGPPTRPELHVHSLKRSLCVVRIFRDFRKGFFHCKR